MRKSITAFLLGSLISLLAFAQTQTSEFASSVVEADNAGSTHTWNTVSNAQISDGVRTTPGNLASNGDKSTYIIMTGWGFTIPVDASIDGIEVYIKKSTDNTSKTYDDHVYIVRGGTIGGTSNEDKRDVGTWPGAEAYFLHGTDLDLWGEVWNPADINASDFGVAYSVRRTGGGPQAVNPFIDHAKITVTYTVALPIKLLSFTGKSLDGKIKLEWITASEIDNDYFTVERSKNGASFSEIARIKGAGNYTGESRYSTYDYNPLTNINYYRLHQTDYDGTTTHSDVIAVKYGGPGTNCEFTIAPNPCPASCNISLSGCEGEEFIRIMLYDAVGNTILTDIPITKGAGFYLNNGNNLAPGVYLVLGATAETTIHKKFILQWVPILQNLISLGFN